MRKMYRLVRLRRRLASGPFGDDVSVQSFVTVQRQTATVRKFVFNIYRNTSIFYNSSKNEKKKNLCNKTFWTRPSVRPNRRPIFIVASMEDYRNAYKPHRVLIVINAKSYRDGILRIDNERENDVRRSSLMHPFTIIINEELINAL